MPTSKKQPIPLQKFTPAKPTFDLQWRMYPNSNFGWQILIVNGKRVYLAVQFLQPGLVGIPMQQNTVAYSEQEADQIYANFLEQSKKPRVIVPGSAEWNQMQLQIKR